MAGRGGKREGAGRKKGSVTIKRIDPEIIHGGTLPLEMRLKVARHLWAEATEADENGEVKITDLDKAKQAADFAEPALPYTSNRLATITHTGPNGGAIEHNHSGVLEEVRALIAREKAKGGKGRR